MAGESQKPHPENRRDAAPKSVLSAYLCATRLKQKVSRALRGRGKKSVSGQLLLPFSRMATDATAFWQRRFYDFNVWSAEKLREKLEYMHANPVKRKLAVHPKDWPWSSWSHYAKGQKGLIRIDNVEEAESRG